MGANSKQEDSNLLSAEAYTGQCGVQCEQCYVNFGQSGRLAPNVIARGKSPAAKVARERAMKAGWDGKAAFIWRDPDREWYDRGPGLIRLKTGYIIPAILRVSTLGDSSIPKLQWCRDIVDLWGDHCFFNSTARLLRGRNRNLREVFHKVVVTTNGGFQRPHMLITPPGKRNFPKTIETAKLFAKAAMGTMTPANSRMSFASFDSPKTLSQMGLEEEEGKVKFYRLRGLPTIEPRLETDAPVVHTLMRFASISDACEFARRYKLDLRYEGNSAHHRQVVGLFGFPAQKALGKRNRLLIGTDADWNVSERRGEMSEYRTFGGAWWRMAGPQEVEHLPWVCDARKAGCKGCGLCATLDGTEPDNANPIMAEHGFVPTPFSRTYVEKNKVSRNPVEGDDVGGSVSEDFYGDILEEVFICENPAPGCSAVEMDEGWLADALRAIAAYVIKVEYFVEGWNTHEEALDLTGYCCWALLRKASRGGMRRDDAWAFCREFSRDAAGVDLFEPRPEFLMAWEGEGWLVNAFGQVREP